MARDPQYLPDDIRAALSRAGLSRRAVMRGAGLASTAAFLAACGVKGTNANTPSSTPAAATTSAVPTATGSSGSSEAPASGANSAGPVTGDVPDLSDTDKTVNWASWPLYIDVDPNDPNKHPTIDGFTAKTGIKVTYTEDVNDNDSYFAKIQPQLAGGQAIAADVFVVTDWMVQKLMRLGYLQQLNHENIPNFRNMTPALQQVGYDPGRKYSMTWQSGMGGIAYNPKATGGKAVETMDQLLTDPSLRGKVTLLTEMRDTVGLVLQDLGFNSSDFTDEQFNKAMAKLQAAVDSKQIRKFTGNDYAQGLAKGDIAAAVAWTGDVVQLKADNPDVQYVLPEAGCTLWSDNFVIPIRSAHKKNAELLINYYYDPAVMAIAEASINYIPPVTGTKEAVEKTDPELAKDQLIFPSDDTLKRAHTFMALDADQEKRYSAAFAKLTGA